VFVTSFSAVWSAPLGDLRVLFIFHVVLLKACRVFREAEGRRQGQKEKVQKEEGQEKLQIER
jgi:hypothetical protein